MSLTERLALLVEMNPQSAIKGLTAVGETAEKQLSKAEGKGANFGKTMSKVGVGMIGVGAVIGGALFEMSEKAGAAELATIKLENSVKNSSAVAAGSTEEFLGLAKAIQSKTAASRVDIIAGEAMLVQFGATTEQVKGLTPLVVDLSRKQGIDLVTANKMVGKALEGSAGALKKAGIIVDEAAYKTDRYAAITDALRKTVGGFAETEGKTFEGSIARLKNQLSDLEAGVGKGAVDAFTNFLGPVSKLSDAFTSLSPETQATIGEFGAYGAAGLIAAGTTATLVGKVVSAKESFAGLSVGLKGLTAAAGVVGAAFAVFEAVKFADSLNNRTIDVKKFTAALDSSDEATRKSAADALVLLGHTGRLGDAIKQAANQNLDGATRMIDAAQAAGVSGKAIDKLRGIVADKASADWQAAHDQVAYTTASQIATGASEMLATAVDKSGNAAASAADDFVELNNITGKNVDPIKELTGAIDGLVSKFLSVEGTTDSYQHLLNGLQQNVKDAVTNHLKLKDALTSTSDGAITFRGALRSVVDDGAKLIDSMVQQGASTDQVNQKVGQLSKQFEDQARAAGVPQPVIDHYLQVLQSIPNLIGTTVTADTTQATGALLALQELAARVKANIDGTVVVPPGPGASTLNRIVGNVNGTPKSTGPLGGISRKLSGARASGGPVGPGEWLVGENGPEILQERGSGYVIPNSALRSRGAGAGTSSGSAVVEYHFHNHGVIGSRAETDRWVQDSIARAGRRAA